MNKPQTGIAVDAATSGNPGPSKYRGVDIHTGAVLFETKLGYATNNVAEFVGLCHAIAHALKHGYDTVYCDSKTAMAWVKNKQINTTMVKHERTKQAHEKMARCVDYLKGLEIHNDEFSIFINSQAAVEKWHTSEWGEIAADYGNK